MLRWLTECSENHMMLLIYVQMKPANSNVCVVDSAPESSTSELEVFRILLQLSKIWFMSIMLDKW